MRNPPVLTHSASGAFTIADYNATKNYAVFDTNGQPVSGTSYANGVVTFGTNYGDFRVSYDSQPNKGTPVSRLAYTYRSENQQVWVPCTPPPPTQACCTKCDGTDWSCCYGGSPCSDGTICCVGCSGGSWQDNWVQVKDTTPAGYTDQHGEWVKISNPASRQAPIVLSQLDPSVLGMRRFVDKTDPNYYVEFDSPVDPDAMDIIISLMFFDSNNLPYLALSFPHDTANFQFVKMHNKTKLRVFGLTGVKAGSNWELEFLESDATDGTPQGHTSKVLGKVFGDV